jgi:hypothetical protein
MVGVGDKLLGATEVVGLGAVEWAPALEHPARAARPPRTTRRRDATDRSSMLSAVLRGRGLRGTPDAVRSARARTLQG